jgi:hypothetical protein
MKFVVSGLFCAGLLLGATTEVQAQAMGPACSNLYRTYVSKRGPKAFALSADNRSCQWATSRNLGTAQNNALIGCQRRARMGCRIMTSQF